MTRFTLRLVEPRHQRVEVCRACQDEPFLRLVDVGDEDGVVRRGHDISSTISRASAFTSQGCPAVSATARASASSRKTCPVSAVCWAYSSRTSASVKSPRRSDVSLMLNGLDVPSRAGRRRSRPCSRARRAGRTGSRRPGSAAGRSGSRRGAGGARRSGARPGARRSRRRTGRAGAGSARAQAVRAASMLLRRSSGNGRRPELGRERPRRAAQLDRTMRWAAAKSSPAGCPPRTRRERRVPARRRQIPASARSAVVLPVCRGAWSTK